MTTQIFNNIVFVQDEKGYYRAKTDFTLYMHRYVWEYYNTRIPDGYEVHHKDFNRANNDISNLQLLTVEEHRKIHAYLLTDEQRAWRRTNLNENARPKAIEWHKSEEGRAWHKEQITKQHQLGVFKHELICTNCGKRYIGESKNKNTFCSNVCKSAYRRKTGKNLEERICVVCGAPFLSDKYKHTLTCSRSCANKMWHNRRGT